MNITANSSASIPGNCTLTASSDGSGDLITPQTEFLINKLKSAVIIPLLFLFGGPANIVNMIVFFRQGLQDRVNLCLFSLAIVDCTILSNYFVLCSEQIFTFTSHETYGFMFRLLTNNKILLFYSCAYGAMLLNVIISCERCLCVWMPLRAKLLLKTKIMAVLIIIGVPFVCFLRLVVTAKYDMACFFDKTTGLTYTSLFVTDYAARHKELLEVIDGYFYGFVMSLGCPIVVLINTLLTTVKLWQTAVWRKQTSSANTRTELAVTKMLFLLSLEFLTCALPKVLLRIYPFINPEFSVKGKYRYFFIASASFSELCTCTGSSLSFVVYYCSSTKYRETCKSLSNSTCCWTDKFRKKKL